MIWSILIMSFNLAVIGIGRLGLCFALNLEKAGHKVVGYDIRDDYIDSINDKTFRSSEPYLNEYVKNYSNFKATSSLKDVLDTSDMLFVTLRTESDENGKYNHDQIESFLERLLSFGKQETQKHLVICSNVQPGYTDTVAERVKEYNYTTTFNPETIAQGQIIQDQLNPSIIIIGEEKDCAKKEDNRTPGNMLADIYDSMCVPTYDLHFMDRTSAELTKVGLNCSLTAKISMANTIGDVAIRMGANPDKILNAIGSDDRIGSKYFKFGFGYGGPCFPRDNRAFIRSAESVGVTAHMNIACDKTNEDHLEHQLNHFCENRDKKNPIVARQVSFKENCPSIEESEQLKFAVGLAHRGYSVIIADSKEVIEQVKDIYGDLFTYAK